MHFFSYKRQSAENTQLIIMWVTQSPVQLEGHRTRTGLKSCRSFIYCYFSWSIFHVSTYSGLSHPAVKQWAQEKLHRWRGALAVVLVWEPQDYRPPISEVREVDWGGQERLEGSILETEAINTF